MMLRQIGVKHGGKRGVKAEVETEVMHRGYGRDLERGKGGGVVWEWQRLERKKAEVQR